MSGIRFPVSGRSSFPGWEEGTEAQQRALRWVPCFGPLFFCSVRAAAASSNVQPPNSSSLFSFPSLPFPSIAALIFLGSLLTFSRAVALPVTSPDCGAPSPAAPAPAPALSRSALLANAGISVFSHYLSLFFRFCVPNFFCCLCDACLFPSCSYSRGKIYVYLCFKNTGVCVCVCVLCPILIRVQLLSV